MTDLGEKLAKLETESRKLEQKTADRKSTRDKVMSYADKFLDEIYESPAFVNQNTLPGPLEEATFPKKPLEIDEILALIQEYVDTPGLNPASGGHLGYIPGGGIPTAALGDYLADISNRYAGIYFASPGAVTLENLLIRWMAEMIGFPTHPQAAAGTLTSGGSIANLTAIVTARDAHKISSVVVPIAVVYLTEQVHHCVDKALRIAGLGEAIRRYIPLDDHFQMDVQALEKQITKDLKAGLKPWLIVASAGTTDTGSVDPADLIAPIRDKYGLWLHVDAAYGGFFLLTDEGKAAIKGLHLADSVVVDPHKGLFLPYGIGAVIVKNPDFLYQSHYYQAHYMQDAKRPDKPGSEAENHGHTLEGVDPLTLSPAEISPELTRHFRALRMWLPLKIHGIGPFIACGSEKIWLARYFHQKVKEIPGMETGPAPQLSVVLFRLETDKLNEQLVKAIHEDGRIFLSSTRIKGRFWLRLAVLSFRTHKDTIDLTLIVLKDLSAQIQTQSTL